MGGIGRVDSRVFGSVSTADVYTVCWRTPRSSGIWTTNDSSQIDFQIVLSAVWPWHHFLVSYAWAALALNFHSDHILSSPGQLCPLTREQLYLLKLMEGPRTALVTFNAG